jgi:hypothetical protein
MKTPRRGQIGGIPAQTENHLPLTQAATAVPRPSRKRKLPCNEPPSEPPETNVLDEKEPRTLVLDLLEPWRSLSDASSPEAQALQKSKRRGSLPSKRPKNQISIAATQAQPESTAELPAKRRKLNPDNPAVPANSNGSIPSKPAKEPHPLAIADREAAHTIQEKGKLREPGPCYQCLHRKSSKASEFPTCMVAVDGRGRRCAWCTHQRQPCTDEKPQSWTKRYQGKDNGESQEERGNANGDVGKTQNSQMTPLGGETGSILAHTESRLGSKVR